MTEKIKVRLDDHNAADYPFTFKKYAQVIIDKDGQDGTVIGAEYVGTESIAPFYTMTYTVKSNRDGSLREVALADLIALNRDRTS